MTFKEWLEDVGGVSSYEQAYKAGQDSSNALAARQNAKSLQALAKVEAARDELKAELKGLRNISNSVDGLAEHWSELERKWKAENERLLAIISGTDSDLLDKWLAADGPEAHAVHLAEAEHEAELGRMEAENERLRAALHQTLDCDHDFQTCKCDDLLALAKEPTDA